MLGAQLTALTNSQQQPAISLPHPKGYSGARSMLTLVGFTSAAPSPFLHIFFFKENRMCVSYSPSPLAFLI